MSATDAPSDAETHHQQQQQQQQQSADVAKKKKSSNSYYYWHGHEKERQRVGDVAPMPTPVLLKKADYVAPAEAIMVRPITKYSWCDGTKAVTIYLDTRFEGQESMMVNTLHVEFKKRKLSVLYVANTEVPNAAAVQHKKQLVLQLSKPIKAKESSYKVKETSGQIVIRLAKEEESSWFELAEKSGKVSEDNDSDDEVDTPALHSSGDEPRVGLAV